MAWVGAVKRLRAISVTPHRNYLIGNEKTTPLGECGGAGLIVGAADL